MILDKMKKTRKSIMGKKELLEWIGKEYVGNINTEFGEVLITAGAGDIDMLVEPIKELLNRI